MVHGVWLRVRRPLGQEENWVTNLEDIGEHPPADELQELRTQLQGRGVEKDSGVPGKEPGKIAVDKKEERKSKKSKKEKKEQKKRKKEEDSGGSRESQEAILDGSRPKAASLKRPRLLFGGTALDPRKKVRMRALKRAKNTIKRNSKRETSSSSDSSGTEEGEEIDENETVFSEVSRVKQLSKGYPGILSLQAFNLMRSNLL